ncbi:MAG: cupin domain-containing protein, partial [Geminicoccaceae bacterium]
MPPTSHRFTDDGQIPNHPDLPLLVYASILGSDPGDRATAFEALFRQHGWGGMWRNGIYGFHHYHSTAHEVLGIAAGRAKVRFGGEHGTTLDIEAGDAVLIPAGVGHCNLGASADLLVVGAYP